MTMVAQTDSSSGLDFKSSDEAWYMVQLDMEEQDHKLKLKYCEFPDGRFDETYAAQDFEDVKALEGFVKNRFRPTCAQLQDPECGKVVVGMTISASFEFGENDVRLYDAVVVDKNINDHTYDKDGNEECTCKFELIWLSGPNIGNKTMSEVKHICLLQSRDAQSDPTLARFLKISSEKLKVNSEYFGSDVSTVHNRTIDSTVEHKSMPLDCESQARSTEKRKSSTQPASASQKFKETGRSTCHWGRAGQDKDLGGISNHFEDLKDASTVRFMLIDNLDKDLSSSAIVDFVYKHLFISCQAQLLPSSSWESYTRGIVIVEGPEELQKLADFLNDPAHMIISSRGRPWVVTEKKLRRGTVGSKTRNQMTVYEVQRSGENRHIGEDIQIFGKQTEEYKRGKKLRKLYMEFADHHRRLHQKFKSVESKILG